MIAHAQNTARRPRTLGRVTLLDRGRDADVYAFGDTLVLRTYREGGDVAPEAAIMRHVGRHGFPVPEVRGAGGRDLWLERLHGPTMLTAVTTKILGADDAAAVLADLHHRLHRVPGSIVHLDLHPANVMMTDRGPVVIDWRNARTGRPGLDIALTAVILAQVSLDPDVPADVAAAARELLPPFLRAAGDGPPPDLDAAVAYRRADANQSAAETGRLDAARRLVGDSGP
jgi:aminoglycoside phosphotransferase (APT) family kinase protein